MRLRALQVRIVLASIALLVNLLFLGRVLSEGLLGVTVLAGLSIPFLIYAALYVSMKGSVLGGVLLLAALLALHVFFMKTDSEFSGLALIPFFVGGCFIALFGGGMDRYMATSKTQRETESQSC